MHRVFATTIFALSLLLSAQSQAAVSMGMMDHSPGGMIDFNTFGDVNPTYNVGGTTVSFGSAFIGQTLGTMQNELIDTSPTGPLRLDPNAPDVTTMFELTSGGLVLGGTHNGTFLTTPLAILFGDPVKDVYFDLGHLDAPGTVMIEAYDDAGQSLGVFGNPTGGWQTIRIADSSKNSISGLSIYVPEGGMDWEGYAIDNLGFNFSVDDGGGGPGGDPDNPDDPDGGGPDGVVPEPATIFIWAGLGLIGLVGSWWKRRS
ncbi:MAG: PEP-CTERM sorting domain-containing protein [Planctomycetales bacterium]|nr:PEP-CTERM sorting domain-containing protein [Planctomycetales bacterium]